MRKNRLFFLGLFILCLFSLKAQKIILINSDWDFQRLTEEQSGREIVNQGSDWSAQYNIEHVNGVNQTLTVPSETLQKERGQLAQGKWERVSLPHTAHVEPQVVLHQWQGICYYRRQITINKQDAKKLCWLEFGAAMHLADVWLNGQHLTQHSGGYTPFVVDVTGLLHADSPNELLVRLDNRNNPLIPPGKPVEDLDFCYYSGLYRSVNLIIKNPVHITHPILAAEQAGGGVFVTFPKVTEGQAIVSVRTQVKNSASSAENLHVRQSLYEWTRAKGIGHKVSTTDTPLLLRNEEAQHVNQQIPVNNPKLWSPDAPSLYLLRTEVLRGNKVVDAEDTRIGIRHIELTKEHGFVINGKPLRLEGTNRHQEYPYVGNALPAAAQYRDIWQIRNNGFNIVRLGHYPQDPSVLDACDELGLLAIEPIPGWQFYNKATAFTEHTFQDIRDLIRRDRNHPSIIMWETTLNEAWPPTEWKNQAVHTAHEEYPGNQCYTSGDAYGYEGFDVCYNDWAEGFHRANETTKAGFIREYYDWEFGGHYSTSRVSRGQGDRALVQNAWNAQWSHNRYRAQYPWTAGQAVWSMYDYNRGYADNVCFSGTADLFRLPKFSLHYFRTQVAAGTPLPSGPMPYEVFACSHWMEGTPNTLQVYGNVDEVELQVNGSNVARQRPDHGKTTQEYVSQPDGGNATYLEFPPFTFRNVKWEPGELKALGYKNGKLVAEHVVRTPGKVTSMNISYFESGLPASRHDLLIVYVRLLDEAGTLCFGENRREVRLQVQGGGRLVGPQWKTAEAGIASFLVATDDASTLRMHAVSGTLETVHSIKLR